MKRNRSLYALAGIALLALSPLVSSAQAADKAGWGPGHGMMWAGPANRWFDWTMSAHFCGEAGTRNIDHFMAHLDQVVAPNESQKPLSDALKAGFEKAQSELMPLCEQPHAGAWSPVERLTVAEAHLNALIAAIHAIKPPLEAYYGALNDDQKKKFDALKPDWKTRLNWPK
jgi:LTXXQ motif family protein